MFIDAIKSLVVSFEFRTIWNLEISNDGRVEYKNNRRITCSLFKIGGDPPPTFVQ